MKSIKVVIFGWLVTATVLSGGVAGTTRLDDHASPDLKSAAAAVIGNWSGTFFPKHQNGHPFAATISVSADAKYGLIGSSRVVAPCIANPALHVNLIGSQLELAGSDADGDTILIRGTVNETGKQITDVTYIINGSASG